MRSGRLAAVLLALIGIAAVVLAIAFRNSGPDAVTGVVVEVDGDLTSVASFVLRDADGAERRFVPESGIDFDGAPISHIRDHLRSGDAVRVEYEEREGSLVATAVTDD